MTTSASPVSAGYSASSSYEDLPIDIRVDGAPDGYRDLSRWLQMLRQCFPEKAAVSLKDACLEMDQSWSGEAVQELGKQLDKARQNGEDMKKQFAQFQEAIDKLSDRLDVVRDNVQDLRAYARKYGLFDDGEYVYPPGEVPRLPQPGDGFETSAQVHPAYYARVTEREDQWLEFRRIEQWIADIREEEEEAHHDFQRNLDTQESNILSYVEHSMPIVTVKLARAAVASFYDEGRDQGELAKKLRTDAQLALRNYKLGMGVKFLQEFVKLSGKASQAERSSASALAFDKAIWDRVPDKWMGEETKTIVKELLEAKPGFVKKVPFFNRVPGYSTALTMVSAVTGVAEGKPVDEALTSAVITNGFAGAGIDAGLALFKTRMGMAGIATTVGLSAAFALGSGYLVDMSYQPAKEAVQDWFD